MNKSIQYFVSYGIKTFKKKCKILYIEADEDYVKLQNGKKAEPRLIYIHEGIKSKPIDSKRNQLKSPIFFTSLGERNETKKEKRQ